MKTDGNQSQAVKLTRKKKKVITYTSLIGLAFVLPAVLLNLVFDWYPMLDGIRMSFYRWDGYSEGTFIGLDNFIEMFTKDDLFIRSIGNMLFFLVWSLILMIPTIIACVVMFRVKNQKRQFVYRVLICLPMVVPSMVFLLLWQVFIYDYRIGVLNQILEILGLASLKQVWLGQEKIARFSILFMQIPWVGANACLIYLGGLKSIPDSVWEACELDGVGPITKLLRFELPLIMGQFKLNLIGVLGGTITGYGSQLILAPNNLYVLVPGLHMYNEAFNSYRYGYSSAIGLVLFVVALVITLITMKFLKSEAID